MDGSINGRYAHYNAFNITDTIADETTTEEMVNMENVFVQLNHPARSIVSFTDIDISGDGLWAIEISNWYNKKPYDISLWDYRLTLGYKSLGQRSRRHA